jgi:phytoene dehydrogenase-like protein
LVTSSERTEQDWDALVNRARETVFARLAKEMGITDLKEHIKFEIVYQPKVWKERFNLEKGAAFGLESQLLAGRLPPPAQPPRKIQEHVLCRRIHSPRHRAADCAAICTPDNRAYP